MDHISLKYTFLRKSVYLYKYFSLRCWRLAEINFLAIKTSEVPQETLMWAKFILKDSAKIICVNFLIIDHIF